MALGYDAQILKFCAINTIDESKISIDELEEIYPKASKLYSEDEFQNACKQLSKDLNENNQTLITKWRYIKDVSLSSIKITLKRLGHSFDYWLGESDVNNLIPQMISKLEKDKNISWSGYVSNENWPKNSRYKIWWIIFIFDNRFSNRFKQD